jgi:plasmid stabilization system protein ParE
MTITLSTRARENLLEIIDYYETQVSEEFASTIEKNIKQQISRINGFERSIPESEIYPSMRKLVISKLPYIAYIREK